MSGDDITRILRAVERLEAGQESLQHGLDGVRAGLESVVVEQKRMRDDHNQLRVEVMGRMDRLQDSLGRLRDEVAVGIGRAEHTQVMTDNVRDEMRLLNESFRAVVHRVSRLESDLRLLRGHP